MDPMEQHSSAGRSRSNRRFPASLGADVTELQSLRAEAAQRESAKRFRNLADTAPVMIWVAGPDKGLHVLLRRAGSHFTGRMLEQELGNGWLEWLVHPDERLF